MWEAALAESLKWALISTVITCNIAFLARFLLKFIYEFFFEEEKAETEKREGLPK